MAKYKIKPLKIETNVDYSGTIVDVTVNEEKGRVWIFVELDEYQNERFLRSVPFSLTQNSEFVRILEEFEAVDKRGYLDTDMLKGQSAIVTMSQGHDKTWYVDDIFAAEIVDDEDSGDLFNDDDEDIVFDEE